MSLGHNSGTLIAILGKGRLSRIVVTEARLPRVEGYTGSEDVEIGSADDYLKFSKREEEGDSNVVTGDVGLKKKLF